MSKSNIEVSKATVQRLPRYLLYLKNLKLQNKQYVSSTAIANDLNQNSVQVRKDLSIVSARPGKPKMGFLTDELIADIEKFLGYNESNRAVLVGAGQLGKTLLSFGGFEPYGFHIVAGFDKKKTGVGKEICGKMVYDTDDFFDIVRSLDVDFGIITVPADNAQEVCDMMVKAGIKAIWNFAPTHLNVEGNVTVKNEDLGASLAMLGREFRNGNIAKE